MTQTHGSTAQHKHNPQLKHNGPCRHLATRTVSSRSLALHAFAAVLPPNRSREVPTRKKAGGLVECHHSLIEIYRRIRDQLRRPRPTPPRPGSLLGDLAWHRRQLASRTAEPHVLSLSRRSGEAEPLLCMSWQSRRRSRRSQTTGTPSGEAPPLGRLGRLPWLAPWLPTPRAMTQPQTCHSLAGPGCLLVDIFLFELCPGRLFAADALLSSILRQTPPVWEPRRPSSRALQYACCLIAPCLDLFGQGSEESAMIGA